MFSIQPDRDNYADIQVRFDQTDKEEGRTPFRRPDYFLENTLIHTLLAEQLVDYNILLVHGSALCMDQKAYLFTAKSGTGKSTHARLWRETFGDRVLMINDDKPLLKIENKKVTVYGTPWDGKHHLSTNTSAELKAILWLNRSETNHIEPMTKADVFPVIFSQAYRSTDPVKMQKTLALEKQLINVVDFYKLSCNMEPDAALTAYNGLRA